MASELNSKALGEVALAYGSNETQPAPQLLENLNLVVQSDAYRTVYRQADVKQLMGVTDVLWTLEFQPGQETAWEVLSANMFGSLAASQDFSVEVRVVNPIDQALSTVVADVVVHQGDRTAIAGTPWFNFGVKDSYAPEKIIVPAGTTLRIDTTVLGGGFFAVASPQFQMFLKEIPRQIQATKLVESGSTVS